VVRINKRYQQIMISISGMEINVYQWIILSFVWILRWHSCMQNIYFASIVVWYACYGPTFGVR